MIYHTEPRIGREALLEAGIEALGNVAAEKIECSKGRVFPPRQKPGSFNLERVMEAVTAGSKQ